MGTHPIFESDFDCLTDLKLCQESMPRIIQAKKINFGDFSKLCGQKWQQMDENDREDFEEKANEDKKRYESEMANYIPPPGTGGKKASQKKKGSKCTKTTPDCIFCLFCQAS